MTDKWYFHGPHAGDAAHRSYLGRLARRARDLREPEIRRLVAALLLPPAAHPDDNFWLLALCEERAIPALVAALEDERFLTPKSLEYGGTFMRLWELVEPLAPEQAVAPLARLLTHASAAVRQNAALGLGAIGRPSCAAPLRRALRGDDHNLRQWALIGIERSLRNRRASPQFLAALFDDVASAVDAPSVGGTYAPGVLLRIDRDRAVAFLTDRSRFRATHPEIGSIVSALADARANLPAGVVRALLDDLEALVRKNSPGSATAFGGGLQLQALTGDADAQRRIERAMKSDDDYVRGLAAEASRILRGVPDAYAVALEAWAKVGKIGKLPDPQRHYVAPHVLWDQVANGAFSQYFFNSYGDDVEHAVAGLEAVGAKKSAAIVRKAAALFGKAGPSKDRATRQRQLAQVDEAALDRLSADLLKDPDRLQVLLSRYAARHPEHFVRE